MRDIIAKKAEDVKKRIKANRTRQAEEIRERMLAMQTPSFTDELGEIDKDHEESKVAKAKKK